MYDKLNNADILKALDDLSAILGFKDEVCSEKLLGLMQKQETQQCVQEIALWLGLPVQIDLSYVSKTFKAGDTNRFHSKDLTRTDWTGRGIEGIVAQVCIPQRLPLFGTKDLEGYRISVRVSENCHEQPLTFIAIMAHELSHVLLHSLMDSNRESELHTDLVPILLGFGEIVASGRKVVNTSCDGKTTTERTTTYGYLTDSQFEVARNRVKTVLVNRLCDKNRLLDQVAKTRAKLRHVKRCLTLFRKYLQHIDQHPNIPMNDAHASKIVEYHALNYTYDHERAIEELDGVLRAAEGFARTLIHYTDTALTRLNQDATRLKLKSEELDQMIGAVMSDVETSGKYVPIFRKLWIFIRLR